MKEGISSSRGYIYTAMTIGLLLLSLSLISFYFTVSQSEIDDSVATISLEELHYLSEDLKKDYQRALKLSGRRSSAYAIGYILNSSQSLDDYVMQPCNGFQYPLAGSQAAIAELMLCGSLFGNDKRVMDNHSLLNWTKTSQERFANSRWNVTLGISNISLVLKDAWTFVVFSSLEIIASDQEKLSQVKGNVSVSGIVSIIGLEDPLYYLKTNESDLVRKFQPCDPEDSVDGTTINDWVRDECYHSSNRSYNGSSFFDRLEGNLTLSPGYVEQHRQFFTSDDIGLEALLNVYRFFTHNVSNYEKNYTWVDYLFWQNVEGDCQVDGTTTYQKNGEDLLFWIDSDHQEKYAISGATCQ